MVYSCYTGINVVDLVHVVVASLSVAQFFKPCTYPDQWFMRFSHICEAWLVVNKRLDHHPKQKMWPQHRALETVCLCCLKLPMFICPFRSLEYTSGWLFQPLWKILVNWDNYLFYGKNNTQHSEFLFMSGGFTKIIPGVQQKSAVSKMSRGYPFPNSCFLEDG